MSRLFHKIQSDRVTDVLRHGLLLGATGDMRGPMVAKTDDLLNAFRPPHLTRKGVDRKTNTYCYLTIGREVVDITSGDKKSPEEIAASPTHTLLEIEVDPTACYVSDLDLYDTIMQLLQNADDATAHALTPVYWSRLQPLSQYTGGSRRPEVMVTYDVPPACILRAF